MHQTTTSLITQLQSQYEPEPNIQIDKLAQLKNDILQKMQLIDTLNITFKQKNEMSFLKTFQKIMNQLSQQLKNAVQAYQNIDQEIERDPKCVLLSKQALFYKQERQLMDKKYHQQKQKLQQVQMKNLQLKRRRNQLRRKSILSQEKYLKFYDKNRTLSLRFNEMISNRVESSNKKMTESTKYHTSADKSRIPSFNSQIKRTFFENTEPQEQKKSKNTNYSLSKNKVKKMLTSENVSPHHVNNFF